jgi:polysaccharide deacetylase family protein (PEP-CTERM system associated)
MSTAAELAFWASVAWLVYPYLGYGLLLAVLARFHARRFNTLRGNRGAEFSADLTPSQAGERVADGPIAQWPTVSVLIAARNEERHIERKIRDTLAWEYPAESLELLIASDASDDRTDEIVQSLAGPRLKFVRMPARSGKNLALNRLAALATGDLLVFCDANSWIAPQVLKSMARHFADPQVGCVTGTERTVKSGQESTLTTGSRALLGHVSLLYQFESKLGSVLTCDGGLFAIRRELFTTLQADLANDLELPLYIGARGYALLYEPAALAWEEAAQSAKEEFHRRRRICGQGIIGAWRLRHYLHGLRLWQFISCKVLRWFTAVPMLGLLVSAALLRDRPIFATAFYLQLTFYTVAGAGVLLCAGPSLRQGPHDIGSWADEVKNRAGTWFALPFFFVLSSVGAFVGVMQALAGYRFAVWQPVTRVEHSAVGTKRSAKLECASLLETGNRKRETDRPAVLSIDVEDWFHILDLPTRDGRPEWEHWERLPSRVERNFRHVLDLLAKRQVRATCFFLGWIAQRYPHLVREAAAAGHEIAAHGYAHRLVYSMSPQEFREDAVRTKHLLEDQSGMAVTGYRAAGFSVTPQTMWFFSELEQAGYTYSSSVFPALRGHGGWTGANLDPHIAPGTAGLIEFPVTTVQTLGRRFCASGGGYLRLFPAWFVLWMAREACRQGRLLTFYLHPREFDPEQPRLPMNWRRHFKCYVNLDTTETKLCKLLDTFTFLRFSDLIRQPAAPLFPAEGARARLQPGDTGGPGEWALAPAVEPKAEVTGMPV